MTEPKTAAGESFRHDLTLGGWPWADATRRIVATEAEARATAEKERDVAALRATVSDRDADLLAVHAELLDLNRRARLADQAHITEHGESCDCALAAALDDLANPAAEPRWPSGPDAERELAAAGFTPDFNVCASCKHHGGDHDLNNVCLICGDRFSSMSEAEQWQHGLAALQEKRDPGE